MMYLKLLLHISQLFSNNYKQRDRQKICKLGQNMLYWVVLSYNTFWKNLGNEIKKLKLAGYF